MWDWIGRPTAVRGIDQFEALFGNDAAYGEMVVPTKNLIRTLGLDRLMNRATIRRRCLIS